MFRVASLTIFFLCSLVGVQSQTDCSGQLEQYATCAANAGGVDLSASCKTDCFADKLIRLDSASASCEESSTEICAGVKACIQGCTPDNTKCLANEIAYYTCSFQSFAGNCTVSCDGSDGNNDNSKGSTSAGFSTTTMIALPVSATALLVVVGLVF